MYCYPKVDQIHPWNASGHRHRCVWNLCEATQASSLPESVVANAQDGFLGKVLAMSQTPTSSWRTNTRPSWPVEATVLWVLGGIPRCSAGPPALWQELRPRSLSSHLYPWWWRERSAETTISSFGVAACNRSQWASNYKWHNVPWFLFG